MHAEALDWLHRMATLIGPRRAVCELGGRDVNGTARHLLEGVEITVGVDLLPGPGVDVVADAADWHPGDWMRFDAVLCTEVLEHTPRGADICRNAHRLLRHDGVFLVTCAGPARAPHSAIDGGRLRQGEHYRNVTEAELRHWLAGFPVVLVQNRADQDLYALAVK